LIRKNDLEVTAITDKVIPIPDGLEIVYPGGCGGVKLLDANEYPRQWRDLGENSLATGWVPVV